MLARTLFALALVSLALAQSSKPPIKVQVNEVIVPVTVTNDKGAFVSNLEAKDFKIYDQGREQHIEFFSRDRNQPVVVGFLIDLSNNTRTLWKYYQDAATDLVLNLLPGDKKFSGYLISYANEPELQVNTTSQPDEMVERLRKLKPGGGAALYDAIYMACMKRQLVDGEPYDPRRVLIIIGDGHDNASHKSLDEVIEIAQRNLVTIYGMSTMSFGMIREGDEDLLRLCGETGGRVEYPLNDLYSDVDGYLSHPSDDGNYALTIGMGAYATEVSRGIFHAIAAITGEVTTQYILRYVPDTGSATGKQFRSIKVVVPDLPAARVRFRKGYYPYAP
ncbi:MAG: VWA domain-containing protein [Bryobacteraceae bacterium]